MNTEKVKVQGEKQLATLTKWTGNNVTYKKKHDTVILLGTASTLAHTPWKTKADFWACAPVMTHKVAEGKKIDLLFEMHPMEYWMTIRDRLNSHPQPVFMLKENPQIKRSMTYPLKKVQDMVFKLNERFAKYFTSTIAYMIALAIQKGYKKIELWGIHMAAYDEEYGEQRQACEAWLAFANGLGIETFVPDESEIFRCPFLYGYEQDNNIVITIRHRKNGLKQGLGKLKAQFDKMRDDIKLQEGAIKDCEALERQFR